MEGNNSEIIDDKGNNIIETSSDMENMFDKLEENLTKFYKEQRVEIRKMKKIYVKNMKKFNKKKVVESTAGINKSIVIPDKLADLIKYPKGTKMARTKLGGELYSVFKCRNLLYKKDKRIMRVDDELANIFSVNKKIVNKSVNPHDKIDKGINFYNLQSYIKRCFDT